MSRLADPTVCPDCRGRVSPDAVCTGCGLKLTGPLATQLFRTMLNADELVERLRRQPAPVRVAAATGPTGQTGPPRPAPATGRRISGRAVPVVLLTLGGLFVFTAVSIFLAYTWSLLPLTVKALMMLAVTLGVGYGAAILSRKGLRGSAEAIWALVAGLMLLDLGAAYRSGLFALDTLSDRSALTLGGMLLAALGLAVALWAQGTAIRRSVAAELSLVLGVLVVTLTQALTVPGTDGRGDAIAVPLLVVVGAALHRRLREAAYGVFAIALLTWAFLPLIAIDWAMASDRSAFWTDFSGWTLLVAAIYAAAPTVVRRLGAEWRLVAAVTSLACVALLAVLPLEGTTIDVLLVAATLLVLAAVIVLAPRIWSLAAGLVGGLGSAVAGLVVLAAPAAWCAAFVDRHLAWQTSPTTKFPALDLPSSWTVPALLVAVLALVLAGARLLPDTGQVRHDVRTLTPAAAALALATGLAGSGTPFWLNVGTLATASVVAAATVLTTNGRSRVVAAVLGSESAGLALVVATRSDLLTGVLATVLALVAAGVVLRLRGDVTSQPLAAVAGVCTVLLSGYAGFAWSLVGDIDVATRGYVLAAVATAFALTARRVTRLPAPRVALEASAALVALGAVLTASAAPASDLAAVLTWVGTAIALLSVLERDRVDLGWLGGLVLTAGTVTRLGLDSAVSPEVYTLPAAALLLGVGGHRLLREPGLSTWRVLGSGLSLALLPSLLITLPDPSSWRALLVGLGAAVALVVGVERRWQAPFLAGSAVLAVLALRFLLPLAAQVLANPFGAWILFGVAGAACLVGGIMWENSLRNLRVASRYLAALR